MKKIFIFLMFFCLTFINVKAEGEYVTAITVDGVLLENFDSNKTEYEINVDSSKDSIKISYIYDSQSENGYIGQGSYGDLNLNYGTNNFTFKVTNKKDNNDFKEYKITINREDTRSKDNSLSSLTVGGKQVVLGNGNDYTVDLDGKKDIVIDANVSNDKASFVEGYGPRTIGKDSPGCEIKVKAENGDVRTYNIKITKTNAKSNDATLKELKLEGIDFEFKANTFEYTLTAKSDVSKVKVTATPNSDKANVEYKKEITLNTGENVLEIKVTAEDSSTKTYKVTITKEEEKPLVTDIKIKNVEFTFDPKKYSYTIETELETLDFDVTLSKDTAKYEIEGNEKLKNKSVITLKVTDEEKTVNYKFKILNKNADEKDENDVAIETTGSKEDFFKKNEMLCSLIIFGIGIFGTLMAIILKKK